MALVTEQGHKPSEAARSLGIGDKLIRRWRQEFEDEASAARMGTDEREELKRLRKENRPLRMENDILKRYGPVSVFQTQWLTDCTSGVIRFIDFLD